MKRGVICAVALAALGISACIIGPKQDDPASGSNTKESAGDSGLPPDVANTEDTGPFAAADAASDTAVPLPPSDASSDASDVGDAACPDGGIRITAIGPWNDAKKCWEPATHTFDCQDGPDGGTAFTCFERISTMEKFLAPTTQIPAGPGYRVCALPGLERCK